MKDRSKQLALLIIAAIYIISPIDALPGPVDDAIVALITYFVNRSINNSREKNSTDNENV